MGKLTAGMPGPRRHEAAVLMTLRRVRTTIAVADSLNALIEALRRLPGVGVKSASRMAFHLLQHDREGAQCWRARWSRRPRVRHCSECHTFTEDEVCATCRRPAARRSKLCVVETPADQAALERTRPFAALLRADGALSPLDGIGPKDIGLGKLFERAPTASCRR
jgi:recombination protein RecR